jgi:hypothetical protein
MSLKRTLMRLKREAEGPLVTIPLRDGTYARLPQRDLATAYLIALRQAQGEDVDHELCRAARNSSADHWRLGMYAEEPPDHEIEDLSEGSTDA